MFPAVLFSGLQAAVGVDQQDSGFDVDPLLVGAEERGTQVEADTWAQIKASVGMGP